MGVWPEGGDGVLDATRWLQEKPVVLARFVVMARPCVLLSVEAESEQEDKRCKGYDIGRRSGWGWNVSNISDGHWLSHSLVLVGRRASAQS